MSLQGPYALMGDKLRWSKGAGWRGGGVGHRGVAALPFAACWIEDHQKFCGGGLIP
jgi:hypothetical protein